MPHESNPEYWFVVCEKFDPASGEGWEKFVAWSGLHHLKEIVTTDLNLSTQHMYEFAGDEWSGSFAFHPPMTFDVNVQALRILFPDCSRLNVLCAIRNPTGDPLVSNGSFSFAGFDLIEAGIYGGVSSLVNCGGFEGAFENSDISEIGLIPTLLRAVEIQSKLRELYPYEVHANCDIWAILRSNLVWPVNPSD